MAGQAPNYRDYTLSELYQALGTIRADRFPDVYESLIAEINNREPTSIVELEDCYLRLDHDRFPAYASRLFEQINALGGPVFERKPELKTRSKSRWHSVAYAFRNFFRKLVPTRRRRLGQEGER